MKDLLITIYGGGDEAVAAAQKLVEAADPPARWIAVEDGLPEEGTPVLVWMPDLPHAEHGMDIGSYMTSSWGVDWMVSGGRSAFPTHWAPLPQPPLATP